MQPKFVSLVLRLIVAIIFVQTLFFKFTAHPDSVHIFSQLGMEPYGRIGVGILEALASVLLFIPKQRQKGIILAIMLMIGAVLAHLFKLGISVNNDHGVLFSLAIIALTASIILLIKEKTIKR